MDRRTWMAGLIAAGAIACSGPASELTGAAMQDAGNDGSSRFDDGVLNGLLDAGNIRGDDSSVAVEGEPDTADADADFHADADSSTDGALPLCASDADSDGVCDAEDDCNGHDDSVDVDGDFIPDGCDACPVGVSTLCDAVVWSVDLPYEGHPIASNTTDWRLTFVLEEDAGNSSERFDLRIDVDGLTHHYDMDPGELSLVRAFLEAHQSVSATVGMLTVGDGVPVIAANTSQCPFSPNAAVLSRVSISGAIQENGIGSITVQIRGYIKAD